jgi:hypothetical protein
MRCISVLVIVIAGAWVSTAWGQAFKPFSPDNDVCPQCTTGPALDRIVLTSGQELRAVIVAENETFLVLEKLGELRAVRRDQVQRVSRNEAAKRPAGYGDEILLKDDIVLAGNLEGEIANDADHFDITVPECATPHHSAQRSTVAAIYRAGKRIYAAK